MFNAKIHAITTDKTGHLKLDRLIPHTSLYVFISYVHYMYTYDVLFRYIWCTWSHFHFLKFQLEIVYLCNHLAFKGVKHVGKGFPHGLEWDTTTPNWVWISKSHFKAMFEPQAWYAVWDKQQKHLFQFYIRRIAYHFDSI